jgi:hypothetical protein
MTTVTGGQEQVIRKIIDYTVIGAGRTDDLADAVYESMQDGWEPFGGVSLAYERNIHRLLAPNDINLPNDFEHYVQAMVKYEMFPGSSELADGNR